MADQQKNRKPPKDPDVFSENKLKLWGPVLRTDARSSVVSIDKDENNNPVLTMDTGYRTEAKNGKEGRPVNVKTPMAPRPFRQLMNLIMKVARSKQPVSFEIDNWGYPWFYNRDAGKNERSKEKQVISRFQVEKREDGVVTFGVTAKGVDGVVFEFKEDDWHITTQNGQPIDIRISSPEAAIAWAEQWLEVYSNDFRERWKEPDYAKAKRLERERERAAKFGNNNGGGNYRPQGQSQSQGNYNNGQQQQQQRPAPAQTTPLDSDDSFDEDLPF